MRHIPLTLLITWVAAGMASAADDTGGTGTAGAAGAGQQAGPSPLAQLPAEEDVIELWAGEQRAVEMLDTLRSVVDSIRSKTAMPERPFAHLGRDEEIHIIPISAVEERDPGAEMTLDEALAENREAIDAIRDQVRLSIHAVEALEAEGYAADQVLTWEFAGTEDLAIVVDDRDMGR